MCSFESPSGLLKKNKWHYVVGSYDGDNIKLWVDGDLVATQNTPTPVSVAIGSSKSLFFSNNAWCGGAFDTFIDEPMVFPYAFDEERLQ